MFGAILMFIAGLSAAQTQVDLKLGWKKGDRFEYVVGVASQNGKAEGRLVLSVDTADEKGYKVSWPEVTYSGGMSPHAAGSCLVSPRGRLSVKDRMPDVCMYLALMTLPEKPIAPSESFKAAYTVGNSTFELTGKLEKLENAKLNLATFALEGTMRTPDGGSVPVKLKSVFDVGRGAFRSGDLEMVKFGMHFFFKLPE